MLKLQIQRQVTAHLLLWLFLALLMGALLRATPRRLANAVALFLLPLGFLARVHGY
jgi:hypothetical protein